MSTDRELEADVLVQRADAYRLFARLLGPDVSGIAGGVEIDALRHALRELGEDGALGRLGRGDTGATVDCDELSRRWVRWFDQGRVAPYECSHRPPAVAGHTPQLADIAGFYRAFGWRVSGDRPDHVVAELEFAAAATLREAAARAEGDEEAATVCAGALGTFLRDHLGGWLDAFAARVAVEEALAPWAPVASAAATFVAADAARRRVIPLRSTLVFGLGDEPFDDGEAPTCGGPPP